MDKKIREGIEACRPAGDDLHDPELADVARCVQDDPQARLVYDRLQEYDAAILKSIDDVSVPPGLSERIVERLRAAQDESNGHAQELLAGAVAAASTTHQATSDVQILPVPRRLALSRRHLTGAALTALLACVLLVVVFNLLPEPSDLDLTELAVQWQAELDDDWQQMADAPPKFEVPSSAVRAAPVHWQWIDRYSTVPVVAYELVHAKAGKAMLYVAQMTREGLHSAPPLKPQQSSGKAIAYWQSGSRIYVLVVDNERDYREFIRTSTAPFA